MPFRPDSGSVFARCSQISLGCSKKHLQFVLLDLLRCDQNVYEMYARA